MRSVTDGHKRLVRVRMLLFAAFQLVGCDPPPLDLACEVNEDCPPVDTPCCDSDDTGVCYPAGVGEFCQGARCDADVDCDNDGICLACVLDADTGTLSERGTCAEADTRGDEDQMTRCECVLDEPCAGGLTCRVECADSSEGCQAW